MWINIDLYFISFLDTLKLIYFLFLQWRFLYNQLINLNELSIIVIGVIQKLVVLLMMRVVADRDA